MRRIFDLLFSARTSLVLLLIFTVAIGSATFVEDKYDTTTAQLVIYKAWWFELIIGLMAVNFLGNLRKYHFFTRAKLGGLLFHIGFILLIIGAGITRYLGFEGTMHIRKGNAESSFSGSDPFVQVKVAGPKGEFRLEKKLLINALFSNDFTAEVKTGYDKPVKISFNRYIKNAEEFVNENVPGGTDMIAIKISSQGTSQDVYLKRGERINTAGTYISFGDTLNRNDVMINYENDQLVARAAEPIMGISMESGTADTTQHAATVTIKKKNLFEYHNVMFALIGFFKQSELDFRKSENTEDGIDVLTLNIAYDGQVQKQHLVGVSEPADQFQQLKFGDLTVSVKYGYPAIRLPFALKLNQFILDRYPGSMSPSSFASEVTVIDSVKNTRFDKRIFMNHVLDYQGYRFFQSSYDTDEQGTILSVNHDFWGTWISYCSYIILLVGFILTLISKGSRYHVLTLSVRKLREKRKSLTASALLLFFTLPLFSQHTENHIVSQEQAEKLGSIFVQTVDGRLEPVHTLAYDVMHKIAKKDQIDAGRKGQLDAMQVMIDVLADPDFWKQQKIIYIREKSVADLLGVDGNYACFNDFLTDASQYKLSEYVDKAFRKSPATQNRFDKEIIKTDERVNLFYMLLQGSMFKIFPSDNESEKWIDWNDTLAKKPITGALALLNNQLQLTEFSYSNLFNKYLQELLAGTHSGDYTQSEKILGYIRDIQRNNKDAKFFPSEAKVKAEIRYNKSNIFKTLIGYYGVLSFLLLILSFMGMLINRQPKWMNAAISICIGLLVLVFVYHTYGMGLRWYLSGHAPWSNGYEALLLVAWSTVLAGFFFVKNSRVIQAATSFLASIILMTAGHSSYDPQLTNLQPVLQSYWLIIHVAVITISYGFLSLGFILGIINLILYLLKPARNGQRYEFLISELSFINEKNLQIGLFLATLGTFLGGVWASESWGRYWGWDAKETWALVIVIVYSIILHLRLVPALKGMLLFNISSVLGYGSVLMTFIGVNYYLSKGLHSYAADDKAAFPYWGWAIIISILLLITGAVIKEYNATKKLKTNHTTTH